MAGAVAASLPDESGIVTAWSSSLGAVALVSGLPMVAILLLSLQPERVRQLVPRLVPLAAGALLGAAAFHLLPDALAAGAPVAQVVLTSALGAGGFYLLDRRLHRESSDALGAEVTGERRARQLLPLTMAGDALHNTLDGMLIAAAFMENPSLGMLTGAAIALHELPRELGTFAVLVRGGMSVSRAVLFNVLTAAAAVIGAIATLAVGKGIAEAGGVLVPFAAGSFLYLAAAIAVAEFRGSTPRPIKVGMVALGMLLTWIVRG